MPKAPEIINITSAKSRLSKLVERASAGEEIIIAQNGKPKAKLVGIDEKKVPYVRGAGRGQWGNIDRILRKPLPLDILNAFESSDGL